MNVDFEMTLYHANQNTGNKFGYFLGTRIHSHEAKRKFLPYSQYTYLDTYELKITHPHTQKG